MKKQITRVSPFQTAKVLALLWVAFTVPFMAIFAVTFAFSDASQKPPIGFLLLMPVLYGVFGYIFTLVGTWLYNLLARYVGGIEFETSES